MYRVFQINLTNAMTSVLFIFLVNMAVPNFMEKIIFDYFNLRNFFKRLFF